MILVDSSIWVDHFRRRNASLIELLDTDQVLCHPFVIGELACGTLRARTSTLELLRTLPEAPMMEHDEVLVLVERHRLAGAGIGWVDAHLVGSALLTRAALWTSDRSLAAAVRRLGIARSY